MFYMFRSVLAHVALIMTLWLRDREAEITKRRIQLIIDAGACMLISNRTSATNMT